MLITVKPFITLNKETVHKVLLELNMITYVMQV